MSCVAFTWIIILCGAGVQVPQATTDDLDNRVSPYSRAGGSSIKQEQERVPSKLILYALKGLGTRLALPLHASVIIEKFSVPAKSCFPYHHRAFAAFYFHFFCILIYCIPDVTFARPSGT